MASSGKTERATAVHGVRPPLPLPRRLLRMRSDAALVERFAAGDDAAFDIIYERHRPIVLAVSMGVLGTTQDAEDATQETFSSLAVALRTRPPAELRPWLIRVARNASIDTTRRRRHRLLTLDGEIPEIPAHPLHAGRAELAVVLDGIRELPEGQRMALLMRELGGHSYSQIAQFLETDEEAVKGLIARARVGLRSHREATELDCSSARATVAAEPDGRRYDKTVRRHLRSCVSCRSYRSALRDDAKALRAALPIHAGSVATGGISTGMLTAAKGTMLGYGITQAATTCAASACAVGAIGGMVFVAPIPKLGTPSMPIARPAAAYKQAAEARRQAALKKHRPVLRVAHPAVDPDHAARSGSSAETPVEKPAGHSVRHGHPRRTGFTVKLPPTRTDATSSGPASTSTPVSSPPTPETGAPPSSPSQAGANNHGLGNGYGNGHWSQGGDWPGNPDPQTSVASTTGMTDNGWSGSSTQGNGWSEQATPPPHGLHTR